MTPKEKAISIIESMSFSIQCALIAVDIAIEASTSFLSQDVSFEKSKEYWYNVKEEIKSIHEEMDEYSEQIKKSQIIAKPFFLLGVPKDMNEYNFNYLEKYCYEKYTDYNTFIYFSNDNNYEFKLLK
jgi:hypothetical protein